MQIKQNWFNKTESTKLNQLVKIQGLIIGSEHLKQNCTPVWIVSIVYPSMNWINFERMKVVSIHTGVFRILVQSNFDSISILFQFCKIQFWILLTSWFNFVKRILIYQQQSSIFFQFFTPVVWINKLIQFCWFFTPVLASVVKNQLVRQKEAILF